MTCQVTGEVSDGNLSLAEGKIILSKEGAEQILNELQDYIETENKLLNYEKLIFIDMIDLIYISFRQISIFSDCFNRFF